MKEREFVLADNNLTHDIPRDIFYSCQLKVPRFGEQGQNALSNSSCAIIGIGGLGCPVAQYLVASGVGRIALYDADVIDASNISRQILYTPNDIGLKKVFVAQRKLQELYNYITIESHNIRINEVNWQEHLSQYDIIIDCTDNFHSKFLIHDAVRVLKKKLVQAGIYQTSGQVLYFDFNEKNIDKSACLRCLWATPPSSDKQDNCSMAGVLSIVAGTTGLMQANTALLALLNRAVHLNSTMQIFDWEQLEWSRLAIAKNQQCVCTNAKSFEQHTQYLYKQIPLEILKINELPNVEQVTIIDVRNESDQHENHAFANHDVMQLSKKFLLHTEEFAKLLEPEKKYILVCYEGNRSFELTKRLRTHGIERVQSFVGGYARLSQLSDSATSLGVKCSSH